MFREIWHSSHVTTESFYGKQEISLILPFWERLRFLFSNKVVLTHTIETKILDGAIKTIAWIEVKE